MPRLTRIATVTCLCLCLSAMDSSRAEWFGLCVPPFSRPALKDVPNALPDVDASLAKAWDEYEAKCGAVTKALHDAFDKEFESACKATEADSLSRAERWKARRTKLDAGECIVFREDNPDCTEDFVKEARSASTGYADAETALLDAYAEAVQAYKEAQQIAIARQLNDEINHLVDHGRLPAIGMHLALQGHWAIMDKSKSYSTWLFSGREKWMQCHDFAPDKPISQGNWSQIDGQIILKQQDEFVARIAPRWDGRLQYEPLQPDGQPVNGRNTRPVILLEQVHRNPQ